MIRSIKKFFNASIFTFVIYSCVAFITFGKLFQTFFQQDEWAVFSLFNYWDKAHLNWVNRLFFYEQYYHIIPLGNIASYIQFRLFGINFIGYALVAVCLHLINSFLLYYFTILLTKSKQIAFLTGVLFLTTTVSQQAITWTATTTGTVGSTLFVLLSLIFFAKFTFETNNQKRNIVFTFLFFISSLGFKETSLFLIIFFPFFYFVYHRKEKKRLFILTSFFLAFLFLYGVIHIGLGVVSQKPTTAVETGVQPTIFSYLFRFFLLPMRFLSQSVLPVEMIIKTSSKLLKVGYPQFVRDGFPNDYIVESVASDIISFFLSLSFILTGYFFTRKRVIFLSLLFIVLSSLPLIFVSGKAGFLTLVDGRHFYVTELFTSIFLACTVLEIYVHIRKKILLRTLLLIVIGLVLLRNIQNIQTSLNKQVAIANTRKVILTRIINRYHSLPNNAVYYTKSDTQFYGITEKDNILPFQSGFGQTLLVWYNAHGENFPACFFRGEYLYPLKDQGFMRCEGRGYGYFRNIDLLRDTMKLNNLSPESVFGFSYFAKSNKLIDITKSLRKEDTK